MLPASLYLWYGKLLVRTVSGVTGLATNQACCCGGDVFECQCPDMPSTLYLHFTTDCENVSIELTEGPSFPDGTRQWFGEQQLEAPFSMAGCTLMYWTKWRFIAGRECVLLGKCACDGLCDCGDDGYCDGWQTVPMYLESCDPPTWNADSNPWSWNDENMIACTLLFGGGFADVQVTTS